MRHQPAVRLDRRIRNASGPFVGSEDQTLFRLMAWAVVSEAVSLNLNVRDLR
jgi:hypothetical protein